MLIQNNYNKTNPSFRAKFLYSDSLKKVVEYAVEHNKFDKINQARKDIDAAYLSTRLKLDVIQNSNNETVVRFSKYLPKQGIIAMTPEDYKFIKATDYTCPPKINPLKFAMEKIKKLSNNAPHNKLYKNVIISNK